MSLAVYSSLCILVYALSWLSSYKAQLLGYASNPKLSVGIPIMPLPLKSFVPPPGWHVAPPFKSLYRNMMLARKRNAKFGPRAKSFRKFLGMSMRKNMFGSGKIDFDDKDDFKHNMFQRNIMRRKFRDNLFLNPPFNNPRRWKPVGNFKTPFISRHLNIPKVEKLDEHFVGAFNNRKGMGMVSPFNKYIDAWRKPRIAKRNRASQKRRLAPYLDPRFKDDFIEDFSGSFDDRHFDSDYVHTYPDVDRGLRSLNSGPVLNGDENNSRHKLNNALFGTYDKNALDRRTNQFHANGQSLSRPMQSTSAQPQFEHQGMSEKRGEIILDNHNVNGLPGTKDLQKDSTKPRLQVNVNDQERHQTHSWATNSILPAGMRTNIDIGRNQNINVESRPSGELQGGKMKNTVASLSLTNSGLAWRDAATDLQRSVDNGKRGDTPMTTGFGQNMIGNLSPNNPHLTQQSHTVAENVAFTFVNDQIKRPASDSLPVLSVNPFTNVNSEV